MAKVTVIARVVAKEGTAGLLRNELLALVEQTRREAGCLEYRLHQELENPSAFVFYENWESLQALERHMAAPHFMHYLTVSSDLVAEKSVSRSAEIA